MIIEGAEYILTQEEQAAIRVVVMRNFTFSGDIPHGFHHDTVFIHLRGSESIEFLSEKEMESYGWIRSQGISGQ